MKKMLILLLMIALLLCACGGEPKESSPPDNTAGDSQTAHPTEPEVSWIYEIGTPWDLEGKLLEIPLTIPGGLKYSSADQIDGDLLLYSTDRHLEGDIRKELCVVDLDTGEITAQKEIPCGDYASVQVLKDCIFLCSETDHLIQQLDKELNVVKTWEAEAPDCTWYMGSGDQLYRYEWSGELLIHDLNTAVAQPLLPENPEILDCFLDGNQLRISFIQEQTGDYGWALLDLLTGDVQILDVSGDYSDVDRGDHFWIYSTYLDNYRWYIRGDDATTYWLPDTTGHINLLEDGRMLLMSEDSNYLWLYDSEGNAIAECQISYEYFEYSLLQAIPSETFGGYFLVFEGYANDFRILYWGTSVGTPGENLAWEIVPEPSEVQQALEQKAQALEEKYGVVILVGEQCDTYFDSFTASQISDYEQVVNALQILDNALGVYPEGFFRQLRQGDLHSIRIQLIADLWADGEGRYGDGYVAFAQELWDHYLLVVDINTSDESTYYHEFSHVVDSYLQWDCYNREDALFSEEGWNDLNPAWFDGYTYDYSWEQDILSQGWFIDSYSTISPTEDRARVMEYAMLDYHRELFSEHFGLRKKLEYYSRCIRDAFDTTGWPDVLAWEQHLYG